MRSGLFAFRLQVQVCQCVIVLTCIVVRPTIPSAQTELAIVRDESSSNPLEDNSSNVRQGIL